MKPAWYLAAIAVGIAVGILLWYRASEPLPETSPAAAPPAVTAPSSPNPGTASRTAPSGVAASGQDPGAGRPAPGAENAAPEYTGFHQKIDVGPEFRRQFEESPAQSTGNSIANAHLALEREMRDDTWAYPLEAEIENSLLRDTSLGNFRREHVECRATMCEIRLSGEGDAQETALQNFNENLQGQAWASRLIITHASTITDGGRVNVLMLFTRPQDLQD